MKKTISLLILVCMLVFCFVSCDAAKETKDPDNSESGAKYSEALGLIETGDYSAAYQMLEELGDYKDCKVLLKRFRYVPVKATDSTTHQVAEFSYNENNLLSRYVVTYHDGSQYVSTFTYDSNGKLIKDAGSLSVTDYVYDFNGNLIKETYTPTYGRETVLEYTYDANGNLIKKVDGGIVYDFTYDTNGFLIREVVTYSFWGSSNYEYIYDTNGNLIRDVYTDSDGYNATSDYVYDAKGNLLKETYTNSDGIKKDLDYTYDANNRVTKKTETNSKDQKSTTDYTYDNKGNLIKVDGVDFDGAPISWNVEYKFVYIPYELSRDIEELISFDIYE